MIHAGLSDDEVELAPPAGDSSSNRKLKTLVTAIGTSIDGAANGVTFAFIDVHIWTAVAIIAGVSFCISATGTLIGPRVGALLERRIDVLGGMVLLGIGASIFYSHLHAAGVF